MKLRVYCMRGLSCAQRGPGIFGPLIVAVTDLSSIVGMIGGVSDSFDIACCSEHDVTLI